MPMKNADTTAKKDQHAVCANTALLGRVYLPSGSVGIMGMGQDKTNDFTYQLCTQ